MNARVRPSFASLLFVIGLAASAAGVYAQATNVQITALSNVGTTLTITGKNFGTGALTVQVGEGIAAVSSSTDTEIVAETTALAPGTHIVKVIRDSNEGGSAHSTLRIQ
jgi:hypothetical protein